MKKATKEMQLSAFERVRLENCQLRMQMVRDAADKQAAGVIQEQTAIAKEISDRLGVDIATFQVDLKTCILTPTPKRGENPASKEISK